MVDPYFCVVVDDMLSKRHGAVGIPIYSGVFFLSFIVGTLLLSFYCFKYFELPAQSYFRRRFKL